MISENNSRRDRGLAMAIGIFFASIIVGALMFFVIEEPALAVLDLAEQNTERESSAKGQSYVRFAIENAHFVTIGFGGLFLVATAVYESRAGGGL